MNVMSSHQKGILQIVLIVVVLALGIAVNFFLSRSGTAPGQNASGPEALLVEVIQPERTSTVARIQENGVVQSRNNVNLTPQVSGLVIEVSENLVSGGVFAAGEVLFRLDPADYAASVDQAEADVSSALANLQVEQAEADIAQREWAVVHPGESIPDLVARKPQIAQSEANLESARARQRSAELSLERVAFSLPFAGRIVETTVELGQRLSANQTYGRVYALESVEVPVSVRSELLEGLDPIVGRSAVVRRTDLRQTREYPAHVTRVEAELDQATRQGQIILRFNNPNTLIPGTFVTVEVSGPTLENAMLIPERAMSEARHVWVVRDGRLAKQGLRIMGIDGDGHFIAAPFEFGAGVVVSPLLEPTESTPVRIVPNEEAQ